MLRRCIAGLVVLAAVAFFFATPLAVRLAARRLSSPDPLVRSSARQRLLAFPRETIDHVYPELVAGEVEDETTNVIAAVLADGQVIARHPDFPERLVAVAPVGSPTCPTALLLRATAGPRELRVLAVRAPTDAAPELRLAVPLDDRVLAAVKARVR